MLVNFIPQSPPLPQPFMTALMYHNPARLMGVRGQGSQTPPPPPRLDIVGDLNSAQFRPMRDVEDDEDSLSLTSAI